MTKVHFTRGTQMADCSHVMMHCIDFRTMRTARRLRRSLGISERDCDIVSVAGGAGSFDQLHKNLSISHRLHHTKTAILTVHEDCGAGAKKEDLRRATAMAREIGLDVRAFYLFINGKWEEVKF